MRDTAGSSSGGCRAASSVAARRFWAARVRHAAMGSGIGLIPTSAVPGGGGLPDFAPSRRAPATTAATVAVAAKPQAASAQRTAAARWLAPTLGIDAWMRCRSRGFDERAERGLPRRGPSIRSRALPGPPPGFRHGDRALETPIGGSSRRDSSGCSQRGGVRFRWCSDWMDPRSCADSRRPCPAPPTPQANSDAWTRATHDERRFRVRNW